MSDEGLNARQKLIQLRKTNFVVGYSNELRTSNYQDDYTAKQPDNRYPDTAEAQEFHKYKSNPRKAHFQVGEDIIDYQSTAKQQFGAKPMNMAALSEETKKDLRSHHFKLGFHSVPSESEYQSYRGGKQEISNKQVSNLRGHHHEFGDLNTYFQSSYSTSHSLKPLTKEEIHFNDMRKTNINVGNVPKNYITVTHNSEYGTRLGPPNKLSLETAKDLRKHHFSEEGTTNYQTSYKAMRIQ